jgi:hypothetical protein
MNVPPPFATITTSTTSPPPFTLNLCSRNNEALTHRLELWLTREVRTLVSLPVTPDRRPSLPGVSRVRGDNEDVEEFYVTYIVGRFMQHILQFPVSKM